MNEQTPGITRRDLEAYVCDTLDPTATEVVVAYLAGNPDLRWQLMQDRSARRRLRDRFSPVLQEPIPERMLTLIRLAGTHHKTGAASASGGIGQAEK
ncbi:hypothetical protein [Azospirillum sp. sgz302134]